MQNMKLKEARYLAGRLTWSARMSCFVLWHTAFPCYRLMARLVWPYLPLHGVIVSAFFRAVVSIWSEFMVLPCSWAIQKCLWHMEGTNAKYILNIDEPSSQFCLGLSSFHLIFKNNTLNVGFFFFSVNCGLVADSDIIKNYLLIVSIWWYWKINVSNVTLPS